MNIVKDIEHDIEVIAEKIGSWFSSEAKEAEKLYDSLSAVEKQAQTWGLGVIAVVNAHVDKDAKVVIPLIQQAFPNLDLSNLQGFIEELLNRANGAIKGNVPLTLEDAVNQLVLHLRSFTAHSFWGQVSQILGNELTIIISPTTVLQKVMATAELVYQVIVKPHIASLTIPQISSNSTDKEI